MKIIFSKKCLEYKKEGHPESPERIRKAYEFLKSKYEFVEAKSASLDDLLLVHSPKHVDEIMKGKFFDPDTPVLPRIYEYARLSAGAAILAAKLSEKEFVFSLMRPPGHHASRENARGFCYFNNIAIAVAKLLENIAKIAILDIDVHHGNGTQDIFFGNKKVLYASIHQYPLYPGTGLASQQNCINFPLPPGTKEERYLQALKKIVKEIKKFSPDVLAISAGFDTYKEEKIANFNLEISSYKKIASIINKIKARKFAVLEGGYTTKLGDCIDSFFCGLKNG